MHERLVGWLLAVLKGSFGTGEGQNFAFENFGDFFAGGDCEVVGGLEPEELFFGGVSVGLVQIDEAREVEFAAEIHLVYWGKLGVLGKLVERLDGLAGKAL